MSEQLRADLNIIQSAPVELELLDGDLNIIQKLDDEPNDVGGLTSAELKAKFDESGNIIKKYINETLIPAVLAEDATEESRKQAEAARVAAEQVRQTNEETRKSNEAARVTAEGNRATAEGTRANAETARVQNETERKTAEASRASAETARANAETQMAANETARQQAETQRQSNETARQQAETQRQSNEAARQNAESQRVSAENARNVWEDYSASKAYAVGNKVAFAGSSYLCIKPCTGIAPPSAEYWRLIAAKGNQGATGPQGPAGPANALTIGSVTSGKVASATITGEAPNQVLNLVLEKGDKGDIGPTGPQGPQGPSGISVQTDGYVFFSVDENGNLICTYTGDEVPPFRLREDGHLYIDMSTGNDIDLGNVTGEQGPQGPAGKDAESIPDVSAADNGKFLRVVNGAWAAATIENANGVSF